MRGHFKVELKASRDLRDADFRAALAAGTIGDLLRSLRTEQRVEGDNLIFQEFCMYMFPHLFSGATIREYIPGETGQAFFSHINLGNTLDAEPTYQEFSEQYWESMWDQSYTAGQGAKRFIEDDIEDNLIRCALDGREEISVRSRWLFLPSEGVSTDIRNLMIFWRRDGDATGGGQRCYRVARIRLKNSGGVPIIINKTNRHVLLVEYTATLASV